MNRATKAKLARNQASYPTAKSTNPGVAHREGAAAARAIFAPVGDEYSSPGPLDGVQIDHTPVDMIVIDELTPQPIGRPRHCHPRDFAAPLPTDPQVFYGARKRGRLQDYPGQTPSLLGQLVGTNQSRRDAHNYRHWRSAPKMLAGNLLRHVITGHE